MCMCKKKKAQNFSPQAAAETPDPANAAPSDTQHLGLPGGAAGAMERVSILTRAR